MKGKSTSFNILVLTQFNPVLPWPIPKSQARNRSQVSQPRQKVTKGDSLLAGQVGRRLLSVHTPSCVYQPTDFLLQRQSLKIIPWYNRRAGW